MGEGEGANNNNNNNEIGSTNCSGEMTTTLCRQYNQIRIKMESMVHCARAHVCHECVCL